MAVSLKHVKVATIPDDPSVEVGTNEWNEEHVLVVDGLSIVGKPTAGSGPALAMDAATSRTLLALAPASTVQFMGLGLGGLAAPAFGLDSSDLIRGRTHIEANGAFILETYFDFGAGQWKRRSANIPWLMSTSGTVVSMWTGATGAANSIYSPVQFLTVDGTGNVAFPVKVASPYVQATQTLDLATVGARLRIHSQGVVRLDRTLVMENLTNGATNLGLIPNGTGTLSAVTLFNTSDPDNAHAVMLLSNATDNAIVSTGFGTAAAALRPLNLQAGGATRLSVYTNGTVYVPGTLSVGTVTPTAGWGRIQIPQDSTDATSTVYIAGLNVVANSAVGYPAIGYNFMSGNAGNTWRFQGNDNVSWIQFQGATINFFNNANGVTAGGLITNRLMLTLVAAGATFVGSATATAFIPSGSAVPTNGMYLVAANTVSFATNSVQRVQIGTAVAIFSPGVTGYESQLSIRNPMAGDAVFSIMYFYMGGGLQLGLEGYKVDANNSQLQIKLNKSAYGGVTWVFNQFGQLYSNQDGTASLPAFTFANDLDCGMYRSGTNEIALATAGVERVKVTASGQLLVGAASVPAASPGSFDTVWFGPNTSLYGIQGVNANAGLTILANLYTDSSTVLRYISAGNGLLINLTPDPTMGCYFTWLATGAAGGTIGAVSTMLVIMPTGFGYGSGMGGTVVQITSKTTGVILHKSCGTVTTHAANFPAGTVIIFTVTNNTVGATDRIIVHRVSGGTAGRYDVSCCAVGAGSFDVRIFNNGADEAAAIVIGFTVIKSTVA